MSVHVLSWVLKHSDASGNERMCLLVLANYADDEGLAWPGLERIAHEMRVSVRTAQRSLRTLEAARRIATIPQGAPDNRIRGDRRPNAYRILRGVTVGTPSANGVTEQVERGDRSRTNGVTGVAPEPSLNRQKKPFAPDGASIEFDRDFWPVYPARNGRKVGKKAALEHWRKLRPADRPLAVEAAKAYAAAVARSETIPRDAERFLKREYWRDWVPDRPVASLLSGANVPLPRLPCETCQDRTWILPDDATEVVPCPDCR